MKNDSINLMGKVIPIAVLLLTTVFLGNVVGRMMGRESVIAGALYALGYKRKELYRHYLKFPLVVAVIGGIVGTILGLFTVRPFLLFMLAIWKVHTISGTHQCLCRNDRSDFVVAFRTQKVV